VGLQKGFAEIKFGSKKALLVDGRWRHVVYFVNGEKVKGEGERFYRGLNKRQGKGGTCYSEEDRS